MSKFKRWASGGSDDDSPRVIVDPTGAPIIPVRPRVEPPKAQILTAAPPPARIVLAHGTIGGRAPVERLDPIPPTTQIVKVDSGHGDPYEQLMAAVPDLARSSGLERPSVDATRMAGVPPLAAMEKWTPTARYYTGATDKQSEGRFEEHRQRRDAQIAAEQSGRVGR